MPWQILLILHGFMLVSFCTCGAQQKKSSASARELVLGLPVQEIDSQIWAMHHSTDGDYWFGSNGRGLYRYDGANMVRYTDSEDLASNTIRSIQEDSLGRIFIGTPAGVSMYAEGSFITVPVERSLNAMWQSAPGDLWFSCNASANDVYRYDGERLYQLRLPRQDLQQYMEHQYGAGLTAMDRNPYAVCGIDRDTDGNMWFGTFTAGAYRYDGKSFLWFGERELSTLPDGRVPGVRSMVQDADGNYWLSNLTSRYKVLTDSSYEKLPGVELANHDTDIKLPFFMSGVVDADATLWMVSYGAGVWKYDGKAFTQQYIEEAGVEVLIISIYKDRSDNLWLCTDNAGVWVQKDGVFVKFEF